MQILKHGELKERKFTCKICGCEFIAGISECNIHLPNGYGVKCPDCKKYTAYDKSEVPLCIEVPQGNPALSVTTPPIPCTYIGGLW
jgi:hypothetical protein